MILRWPFIFPPYSIALDHQYWMNRILFRHVYSILFKTWRSYFVQFGIDSMITNTTISLEMLSFYFLFYYFVKFDCSFESHWMSFFFFLYATRKKKFFCNDKLYNIILLMIIFSWFNFSAIRRTLANLYFDNQRWMMNLCISLSPHFEWINNAYC